MPAPTRAGLEAMLDAKKPKPAIVKPTAPKAEPSLYKAIRERLEAKDKETLHSRTVKAVEAVWALPELGGHGTKPVEVVNVTNIVNQAAPSPAVPWSLDGLVVDPDPKGSVGKAGIFWDSQDTMFKLGISVDPEHSCRVYTDKVGCDWDHFAYLPGGMLEELFKRTTGYEVGK